MFILISIPLFRLNNPVFPQTDPLFAEFNRVWRSLQVSKFSQNSWNLLDNMHTEY